MKKVYIHNFSKNPLPGVFAFILVIVFGLFLLEGLTRSESEHCLKTSTIKTICKWNK